MGVLRYFRAPDGVKLAVHDLGGSGPILLVLHCSGFLGQAYLPLAQAAGQRFHSFALDIRGHGESAHAALPPPPRTVLGSAYLHPPKPHPATTQQLDTLIDDVLACASWLKQRHAGTQDMYVFGHSLGGVLALAAEARQPGTFSAMYLFEPVLYKAAEPGQTESTMSGVMLSTMATKRKTQFDSRQAALDSYAGKQPFSAFDRRALKLYVEHGFRSIPGGGGVELVCKAATTEAWIYLMIMSLAEGTFERLPNIGCPATIASGTGGSNANSFLQHWPRIAAHRLRNGRFDRFEGLGHFGPFEKPDWVADRMLDAFAVAMQEPRFSRVPIRHTDARTQSKL